MVGCARATVYRTLYRFEDLGEDALLDQRQLRPPSKVTDRVQVQLVGYIDRSPQDFGWQRTTWTLELLAVQLTLDTGVRLSKSHVRNVLLANQVRRGRPRAGLRIPVRGRSAVPRDAGLVARACSVNVSQEQCRLFSGLRRGVRASTDLIEFEREG
jgi:hypothetical protein